jgi:hypothetical protein
MLAMCDERDRLWASYDKALTAYIRAIDEYGLSLDPDQEAATIRELLKLVRAHREAIHQHCQEHGCDPDHLRAMEA